MSNAPIEQYRLRIRELLSLLDDARAKLASRSEPIAIVGMGNRFPGGGTNPDTFFRSLEEGVDAIQKVPEDRWPSDLLPADKPAARWASFLPEVDRFDAGFFQISPREAASMDPQQRLLLEVSWEALEDAGAGLDDAVNRRTGVFVGLCSVDYKDRLEQLPLEQVDAYCCTGNVPSTLAGRLSYTFGFQGPSVTIDTACSSSLVAIHLACQSLRSGESDVALAGGVSVLLSPLTMAMVAGTQALSPEGRCKTFDAGANGFVRGEGCGVVVLKRLSDALRDGDRIHALIRGSVVNQDGHSTGLTAPNVLSQETLLRDALANARVSAAEVGYVETHGTGTSLGDPIEYDALRAVLGNPREDGSACVLGAVKTNLGHLEAAAGVASLIKTVLCLKREVIPPNLHLKTLNPRISLEGTPFVLPSKAIPWKAGHKPRIAGVSSFGISGTNAHLIVEEAPRPNPAAQPSEEASSYLLPLSAKTPEALVSVARSYSELLAAGEPSGAARLHDIAYTASVRRAHHEHRLAVVGSSKQELASALDAFARGETPPGVASGRANAGDRAKVVFVFPGQGSQWVGMGRGLIDQERAFREALEACDEAIRREAGFSVLEELRADEAHSRFDRIDVLQPTLVAIEIAIAALLRSWGIEPDAVVGHSMGEVAAAHVAGALRIEDAAKIICRRSRILRKVSGKGQMALVELTLERAQEALRGYEGRLSVAVSNGPRSTVIAGDTAALDELLTKLERAEVYCRRVKVDVASHSPQMDPLLPELREAIAGIAPQANAVPMISTVTGNEQDGRALVPEYWLRNLREPVLFSQVTRRLCDGGRVLFVEISPHPILLRSVEETLRESERGGATFSTMRRDQDERRVLLESLGGLYVAGHPVPFQKQYPSGGRISTLPAYPWQRERHWLEGTGPTASRHAALTARRGAESHPLLGAPLQVAVPGAHVWEQVLRADVLAYAPDHKVGGEIVLPGAAYLEMALSAAAEAYPESEATLGQVAFEQMLVLPAEGGRTIQSTLTEQSSGELRFEVSSLEGDAWVKHASVKVLLRTGAPWTRTAKEPPHAVRARCPKASSGPRLYEQMRARGLEYGPSYQGVEQLWIGSGEALGRVRVPEALAARVDDYRIHPAFLDACLQVLASVFFDDGDEGAEQKAYVPIALERARIKAQPSGAELWVHARLQTGERAGVESVAGELELLDGEGQVLAELRGLRLKCLDGSSAASEELDQWNHELVWRLAERATREGAATERQARWLVLTDGGGVGRALAERLQAQGEACVVAAPLREGATPDGCRGVSPTGVDGYAELLKEAFGDGTGTCSVVYLWALDAPSPENLTLEALHASQELTSTAIVDLIQALARAGFRNPPRLWLVTRGAQAAGTEDATSVVQAPIWGLGSTIAHEHPELRCSCIDLPLEADATAVDALTAELAEAGEEERIALRPGGRYVARLVRRATNARQEVEPAKATPAGDRPFCLETSRPGTLDALVLRETTRRPPKPGEVEIEVRAAGLNFLDVLFALGAIPTDDPDNPSLRLGGECAGTVVAIGEGVEDLRVGQDVVAIAEGAFGRFVTVPRQLVAPKPTHFSFEEAATVPIGFLTASYALNDVGRLAPGDRVLIHAAAGGVGLCAVQLAKRAGAEIFATAGSPEKRELLRSLGVAHVMDSRSLDFADEVMERTGGEGVDVVLNSLSGPFIPASFGLLRDHGRFLELGKRDYYEDRKIGLKPFLKNLTYSLVDIRGICRKRPRIIRSMLEGLMQRFEAKELEVIPHRSFPIAKVTDAFHTMAKAEHVGKLVISLDEKETTPIAPAAKTASGFRADATYLVTGGLGGIGLVLARWLVEQGARHLVLVGRSGAPEAARATLAELAQIGADVRVEKADVSDHAQIAEVFSTIDRTMPPLAGIFHCAAVLDDGTLLRQSPERFRAALAPKVDGAWNLHTLSRGRPLDAFVLFSSAASLLGSPGQANYCAANAFLDALSHHRRALGLPSLCVNWGAWSDVGLAAAEENRGARLATRGLASMAPDRALAALGQALASGATQIVVMPFDLRQWRQFYPKSAESPLFSELSEEQEAPKRRTGAIRDTLVHAEVHERRQLLEAHLREQIARVLRVAPARVERTTPLRTIGLDSLMAIELRNRLEDSLGLTLSATLVFGYPTVAELSTELASRMQLPLAGPAPAPQPEENRVKDEVEALSSEGLVAALAEELAAIEQEKIA